MSNKYTPGTPSNASGSQQLGFILHWPCLKPINEKCEKINFFPNLFMYASFTFPGNTPSRICLNWIICNLDGGCTPVNFPV